MKGRIISINISVKRGLPKRPVESAKVIKGRGIEGDAHAGSERPVSLLAVEGIRKLGVGFLPGDFAENITTEGIDLISLPMGTCLRLGRGVVIRIVKLGKECHSPCGVYRQHGRCVMPKEGIFAEVIVSGEIKRGDAIAVRLKFPA